MKLPLSVSGLPVYDVAVEAVKEAGRVLAVNLPKDKEITYKGRGNVVTNLDIQVEELIKERLLREFPGFGILCEEGDAVEGDTGYTWVLDPLDGTRNYASGSPIFTVNLGLAYEDEVVMGLTYDPMHNELFHSVKGQGVFVNDMSITVTDRASVEDSVVALDMGYSDERAEKALRILADIWPGMQSIRIMGSAALALAYVAAGRIDLYFHHHLAPWDVVSGILLVEEAGGMITRGDGSDISYLSTSVVASNEAVHSDFLRLTEGSEYRAAITKSIVDASVETQR